MLIFNVTSEMKDNDLLFPEQIYSTKLSPVKPGSLSYQIEGTVNEIKILTKDRKEIATATQVDKYKTGTHDAEPVLKQFHIYSGMAGGMFLIYKDYSAVLYFRGSGRPTVMVLKGYVYKPKQLCCRRAKHQCI